MQEVHSEYCLAEKIIAKQATSCESQRYVPVTTPCDHHPDALEISFSNCLLTFLFAITPFIADLHAGTEDTTLTNAHLEQGVVDQLFTGNFVVATTMVKELLYFIVSDMLPIINTDLKLLQSKGSLISLGDMMNTLDPSDEGFAIATLIVFKQTILAVGTPNSSTKKRGRNNKGPSYDSSKTTVVIPVIREAAIRRTKIASDVNIQSWYFGALAMLQQSAATLETAPQSETSIQQEGESNGTPANDPEPSFSATLAAARGLQIDYSKIKSTLV